MRDRSGKRVAREPLKIEFLPTARKRRVAYMHECGIEPARISVIMALDVETVQNIIAEYDMRHADLWGGVA